MKKNLKKLSSLVLAFALVLTLSVTAFGAYISADKAKEIALSNVGYTADEVSYLNATTDYDDGVKVFDVSFIAFNADGSFTEYEYEIDASSGRIIEKDVDTERSRARQVPVSSSNDIGVAQAKRIALDYFGVKAEDVKFLQAQKDYDDGHSVYEIEFCVPYSEKFSCEVSAVNGLVQDAEKEAVRGIFEKFELFFEVLLLSIFGR